MCRGDESPLIGTLASLTQELHFHQGKHSWVRPTGLAPYLTHLGHFTNVTTLGFVNLVTSSFHAASLSGCFGSLITSVRRLRLNRPIARPVSLAQTIFLFPAAVDIEIQYPQWSVAEEDVALVYPPPGRLGFTGTLHLRGFGERWPQFFTLLSTRSLRFQKTRLMDCESSTSIPTQSLLDAVSGSTRTLHLVGFGNRKLRPESRRKLSLPWDLEHLYSNITLHAFGDLESLAFRMTRVGIRGVGLARLLDSISSPRFSTLALDISDQERGSVEDGGFSTRKFLNDVKVIDPSLCKLATRTFQGAGKRFILILLGNNPAAVARSLTEFHEVGNTWEGEKVIGNGRRDHYWTFRPAKSSEGAGVDETVLSFVNA